RHTSSKRDWSSDVCSSDLPGAQYRGWHRAPTCEIAWPPGHCGNDQRAGARLLPVRRCQLAHVPLRRGHLHRWLRGQIHPKPPWRRARRGHRAWSAGRPRKAIRRCAVPWRALSMPARHKEPAPNRSAWILTTQPWPLTVRQKSVRPTVRLHLSYVAAYWLTILRYFWTIRALLSAYSRVLLRFTGRFRWLGNRHHGHAGLRSGWTDHAAARSPWPRVARKHHQSSRWPRRSHTANVENDGR